jgi:hypothetical protein
VYTSPTAAPELVSPREWLCKAKGCCKPCAPNNAQGASCTKFIDYGMLEFRPTGGCRSVFSDMWNLVSCPVASRRRVGYH